MGEEPNFIGRFLTKVFGSHWKTSVLGLLAALPQITPFIMQYLTTLEVPQKYLNLLTLLFGVLCTFAAADSTKTSSIEGG